jgi:hypothetical protein
LALVKLLYSHEVLKSFIIYIDVNLRRGTHQLSTLLVKGVDNGQHLLIIDDVVDFSLIHSLAIVPHRVLVAVRIKLGQDTRYYSVRGIGF